ncbi:MAG: 2-phosphosulfolactate phosphatase [Planctomycetota bacterium]
MQIATTLLPHADQAISDRIGSGDTAVVIDVLRATSVMCTALQNGAETLITCRKVTQARATAEEISPTPLLCGERGCKPIDGFDLGNSTSEYTVDRVGGRTLILTTTNGTRAIEYAGQASELITASFLNVSAVIDYLSKCNSVHLVCAGTEGEITVEDVLLAGALVARCESQLAAEIRDDDSLLARQLWHSWFPHTNETTSEELAERLRETRGGRNLLSVGYDRDLERCAEMDSVNCVPVRMSKTPATFRSNELCVSADP